jgi:putative membrane protein
VDWISPETVLVALHVLANVVWIGALLAVAVVVAAAPASTDPASAGGLARLVYVRLAVPAFLVSFGAGAARIALTPIPYAHMPWFHAKLTFALAVIVLHHVIGARAKGVENGRLNASAGARVLGLATLVCAAGAVLLGVAKALPGR